jgi:transcriptional regulator with XRE-family HTH domain
VRTLEEAIGGELRRLREAAGVRQEAIAHAAQMFGMDWTQSTVSAIEGGRRGISFGEAGILPNIVQWAGIAPYGQRVLDLIPDTEEVVLVAPGVEASLRSVRPLYGTAAEREAAPGYKTKPPTIWLIGEAERKAARALRASPEAVLQAAVRRWGHSLATERDVRVGDPNASAQKRGRVTRTLIRELRPDVKRRRRRAQS